MTPLSSTMPACSFVTTVLPVLPRIAESFVTRSPLLVPKESLSALQQCSVTRVHEILPPSYLLSDGVGGDASLPSTLLLSDGMSAAAMDPSGSLSGLRTFFIVVGAVVVGFVLLATFTAAFVVPKAAEQLESDTKRLRPGLWEDFEARLGEGEMMVARPDLLQELGDIMKPVIVADYEAKANEKIPDPQNPFQTSATTGAKGAAAGEGSVVDSNDRWKD